MKRLSPQSLEHIRVVRGCIQKPNYGLNMISLILKNCLTEFPFQINLEKPVKKAFLSSLGILIYHSDPSELIKMIIKMTAKKSHCINDL